jgi:hypothetical protein
MKLVIKKGEDIVIKKKRNNQAWKWGSCFLNNCLCMVHGQSYKGLQKNPPHVKVPIIQRWINAPNTSEN